MVSGLDPSDINDLNRYQGEGRRVVLRVNSKMLHAKDAKRNDLSRQSRGRAALADRPHAPQGFSSRSSPGPRANSRSREAVRCRKRTSWATCTVTSPVSPSDGRRKVTKLRRSFSGAPSLALAALPVHGQRPAASVFDAWLIRRFWQDPWLFQAGEALQGLRHLLAAADGGRDHVDHGEGRVDVATRLHLLDRYAGRGLGLEIGDAFVAQWIKLVRRQERRG